MSVSRPLILFSEYAVLLIREESIKINHKHNSEFYLFAGVVLFRWAANVFFFSTVESHLASNVNKSKLVQKDLQVAKKLQEEEDHWAKVQSQKQHTDL